MSCIATAEKSYGAPPSPERAIANTLKVKPRNAVNPRTSGEGSPNGQPLRESTMLQAASLLA